MYIYRVSHIVLLCSVLMSTQSLRADTDKIPGTFPGIEGLMTEEEQTSSGINRLTEEELHNLNTWLIRFTAQEAPTLKAKNPEVAKVAKEGIKSRITGDFTGWSGKTLFKLENGQIWKQRYGRTWKTKLSNPEVIIRKGGFGAYEMEVVSESRSIGVKRVK